MYSEEPVTYGFTRLWSPERRAYIEASPHRDSCVFCVTPTLTDEQSLIVHRGRYGYVLLNLYPYNSGHLLVVPYRHIALYDDASPDETADIAALTQTAMRVLRTTSRADGFNIGVNQGSEAGAGIPAHLHQHLVPRWSNDTNFLAVLAHTRVLPRLLDEVRDELASAWPVSDGHARAGSSFAETPSVAWVNG